MRKIEQQYLEPVEDGLVLGEWNEWSRRKLDYLYRYLNASQNAIKKHPWQCRRYLDFFSGPGKCFIKDSKKIVLGSPLLAFTIDLPFTDYVFVDLKNDNINALEQRTQALQKQYRIRYHLGDSNSLVRNIVNEIIRLDQLRSPDQYPSFNLAFLDPSGLELCWDTIKTLSEANRMDMIIYYPEMGLNRYMNQAYQKAGNTIIDKFFGSQKWRDIYWRGKEQGASNTRIQRELMNYYQSRLTQLGYLQAPPWEISPEPSMRTSGTKGSSMYRLLFASKNKLGVHLWDEIKKRDISGQRRLF